MFDVHAIELRRALALAALLCVAPACDASSTDGGPSSAPTASPSGSPSAAPGRSDGGTTSADPHHASDAVRRCAESKGELGSIADAVARLNALGTNVDGPCFIATLPRPLAVVATLAKTSAQPAGGRGAPRILFLLPKLIITAVPAGDGSKVLEFGEWTGTTRTFKGEIGLPVTAPLAPDAPFVRILDTAQRTKCANCHREEEPHPTIPNAFTSLAFQPEPETVVTVPELEELHTLCTNADDLGTRCAMIHAVFDFGEITQGSFSPVVARFQSF